MAKIVLDKPLDLGDALVFGSDEYENKLFEIGNKDKEWLKSKQFVLGTVGNLAEIMDVCIASGKYALDLETSGLDNRLITGTDGSKRTVDQIAGVCLSPDGIRGYYIPLRHIKINADGTPTPLGCNIPLDVFDREFRRLMKATEEGKTVAVFHNAKFDQEFLDYNGIGLPYGDWGKISTWHDTMIMAFLQDSRQRVGLKGLSEEKLKIKQLEYDDMFPAEMPKHKRNFAILDPEIPKTVWYAAGDAICTILLYDMFLSVVTEPDIDNVRQKIIYDIEKGCVIAVRWMERNRIHVDRDKVKELILLGHKEWFACIWEVYAEANKALGRDVIPGSFRYLKENFVFDEPTNHITMQKKSAEDIIALKIKSGEKEYQDSEDVFPKSVKGEKGKSEVVDFPSVYDITNPPEIGQMLLEMGVPDLPRTEKSGQVQTSASVLDNIIDEHEQDFPFVKKVKRFREVNKALSTYLYAMHNECDPTDNSMRIGFFQLGTDTGRFNTRANKSAKMIGWPSVNLQSIPRSGASDRPECMQRLRECISSRDPNSFIVAIDYSGVELRIVTNLSREPLWLSEFFRCSGCGREFDRGDGLTTPEPPPPRCPNCGSDKIGDLHTLTGLAIFGQDSTAKPNWKDLRGMAKGVNFALCYGGSGSAVCRSTGVDRNEGGRIERQFKGAYKGLQRWWGEVRGGGKKHLFVRSAFGRRYPVPDIVSADGGLSSKAERNAINGPIQASSADITKIAMSMIYKKMKELNWQDKVRMIITMHDELVFDMDGDAMEEAIKIIIPIMTQNNYIKRLKWPIPLTCDVEIGRDWSVPWDLNGMRYKEVRFVGNKKYKDAKKLPEGQSWDQLLSVPEDLKSFLKLEDTSPVSTPPAVEPVLPVNMPSQEFSDTMVATKEMMPVLPVGADYEYKLKTNPNYLILEALADVIVYCWGKGTHKLKVTTKDGFDLTEVLIQHPPFNGNPVFVNGMEFYFIANSRGL